MRMFSFLYRVFYDRTLFRSYIKDGKGYGLKPLLALTLFACLCMALRLSWLFFFLSPRMVDEVVARIPQIVFEKGVITVPENVRYAHVFENGRLFFVFDTTNDPVNLQDLPPTGFYITSDAILTVRRNEISRIPFLKFLEKTDFTLDQENIRTGVTELVSVLKWVLPPVMFVFCIPGIFGAYLIMMLLAGVLSLLMTQVMKTSLHWEQRARLAALSVMPAGVINMVGLISGTRFQLGVFGILVIVIYMYCFLKDGQNPSTVEENVIER